jgi:DNA-binding transcriptional LysR family regulator
MLPSLASIIARIKLRQLRLLILLDECRSLHKAAERASMTQSGVTKALHEIETILGATLFDRSSQGVAPNDLGRCVIRYARLINTDLSQLREEMDSILYGYGGRLAVGVIMGAIPVTLTGAIVRLRIAQPGLSVEIIEDTSARMLSLLDQGRLDLAICRASVSRQPELYDFDLLRDEPLAVVVHPEHRLARQTTLSIEQLDGASWIVYPSNMPMRTLLEREFSESGLQMPAYPIETASTFATISLLQADPTLVALMPTDVAQFCARFGIAHTLPLELRSRTEPFGIATRRGAVLSPAARMCIKQLKEGSLPLPTL